MIVITYLMNRVKIKDVDKETKSISHHRNWVHWKFEITGLGLEGYDS